MYGILKMSLNELLIYISGSLISTLLSIMVALIFSAIVPFQIGPDLSQPVPPGKVFTESEIKQAEHQTREMMDALSKRFREQPLSVMPDIKRNALIVSWIPWLFTPFFIRFRHRFALALMLVLPGILVFTPIMVSFEVLTFGMALIVGDILTRYFRANRAR